MRLMTVATFREQISLVTNDKHPFLICEPVLLREVREEFGELGDKHRNLE